MATVETATISPISRREHLYKFGTVLAAAVMCLRIVLTYSTFSQTFDEPFHIACGMEWLDKGVYRYEAQHPPLSRIAAAIGPYLAGERSHGMVDAIEEGNTILGDGARYKRNLSLARLGELPFVLLAFAGVWVWSRRYYGPRPAFFSVLLFSMLPPVLAHGGLATTDMAITAACTWAFYSFTRFLAEPTWRTSLALGFWCGIALISKFTAILFLGCGFVTILAIYIARNRPAVRATSAVPLARLLAAAAIVSCVLVWACFRFSWAPLFTPEELQAHSAEFAPLMRPGFIHTMVTKVPLPAHEFFRGIGQVLRHDKNGQWGPYLLGQRREGGWWYFFPVVLAIKTPIGFLILAACGASALLLRLRFDDWKAPAPVIYAITILLVCLTSRINLGVRHVLPMYPLLSIAAGYFIADSIARSHRLRTVFVLCCLVWCCLGSLLAHPDYLAWFNEIASRRPEYFRVDSDLDWGQDLYRLSKRLHDLHAPSVALSYFGTADLHRFGLPPVTDISCDVPFNGYVAISVTMLYLAKPVASPCPERFAALGREQPAERIGKSIFLYHFPPSRVGNQQPANFIKLVESSRYTTSGPVASRRSTSIRPVL